MIYEFLAISILIIAVIYLLQRVSHLQNSLNELKFQKSSQATKHGMTFEQLAPFTKDFPGDPRAFRFIGNPIDGIHFGEDKVTFIEFKTGESKLSNGQRKVKNLIDAKRIEWKEIRM